MYTNLFLIPEENTSIFENDRKHELSTLEKIGLEAVLADFIQEYEEETHGEVCIKDIKDYIRYNADSVDILDGEQDTYIFDHYAVSEVWTTKNGCLMLSAVDLEEYTRVEPEVFEESDIYERPNKFDLWVDFKPVLFRLN